MRDIGRMGEHVGDLGLQLRPSRRTKCPRAPAVDTCSWPISSCGKKPFGRDLQQADRKRGRARGTRARRARSWRRQSSAPVVAAQQPHLKPRSDQPPTPRLPPGACVTVSSREHSIGVSVSDTNIEARIATVTTTANSLKMRPITPPISSTGMNTATSEIEIEMMVKPISRAPLNAASNGGKPVLLHMPEDVLQHDDRVVDDQADRQRQPHQRDVVDREAEQIHRAERGDQRDRHGERRDERRRHPPQEQEDHHDRPARWSSASVNSTSLTAARIEVERSLRSFMLRGGRQLVLKDGSIALTRSTTSTVLASGWRCTARMIARVPSYQLAVSLFSTEIDDAGRHRRGAPDGRRGRQ